MTEQRKKGPARKESVSLDDVTYGPLTRRSFLKAGIAVAAATSGNLFVFRNFRKKLMHLLDG